MEKDKKILINIKVEKEVKEMLQRKAKEYNLSMTAFIVQKCSGNLKQVQNDFKKSYKKPNSKWIAACYSKKRKRNGQNKKNIAGGLKMEEFIFDVVITDVEDELRSIYTIVKGFEELKIIIKNFASTYDVVVRIREV